MESSVSVIVPVYNAEKTLDSCLDSVLSQDWPNLSVFAMDNKSTDASASILSKHAAKDNRLHVGFVSSSGVSRTRNAALAMANSRYICFVDSDDILPENSIRSRVEAIESSDAELVIAPYSNLIENASIATCEMIREGDNITADEYLTHLSEYPNHYYYSALWNKLYRTDILRSHHIRFDETLLWGEDFMFNVTYARYIRLVSVLHTPVYKYNRSLSGLSGQSGFMAFRHPVRNFKARAQMYSALQQLFGPEESKKLLAAFLKPTV